MSTWRDVHAGDVVLGYDGQEWGVLDVERSPRFAVTMTRFGHRLTGHPDPGAPIVITQTVDHSVERTAVGHLLAVGFNVGIINESIGESA